MGDIPRDTYNLTKTKHYVNVRQQVGKPLVYSDWNEMDDIRKYELQNFIKNFIGNGIPDNEGFFITPIENASNDFLIKKGYCLVNGRIVINEDDIKYSDQHLQVLKAPQNNSRIDTVYLDVWEREVNSSEDSVLIDPGIAIETCVRIKREWVVRVEEGVEGSGEAATLPSPRDGHDFYALATLTRNRNEETISSNNITDKRFKGLNLEEIAQSSSSSIGKFENLLVTGTVGIGTPLPSEKLEVNGTVKATALIGNGSAINDLNGENITAGTIANDRIPTTIARESRFDPVSGHKHTGVEGDGPKIPHSNLSDVLQVDPNLTDDNKDKHVSDAQAKGWQDHVKMTSGNPHGTNAAQLIGYLANQFANTFSFSNSDSFTDVNDTKTTSQNKNVGFIPKLVLISGGFTVTLGGSDYGGGFSSFRTDKESTMCTSLIITNSSPGGKIDVNVGVVGSGIFHTSVDYIPSNVTRHQAEDLDGSITFSSNGIMTLTLKRKRPNTTSYDWLDNFHIDFWMLCIG